MIPPQYLCCELNFVSCVFSIYVLIHSCFTGVQKWQMKLIKQFVVVMLTFPQEQPNSNCQQAEEYIDFL